MRTKAKRAPFAIGTKVRYPGPDYQPWGHPWVRGGDVGVVVGIIEGIDGQPWLGADLDEPYDASSVIQFHDDPACQRAVSADHVRTKQWDGSIREYVAVSE